jgi:glycine/D-amino acid oxidase-like deaminating enzyme
VAVATDSDAPVRGADVVVVGAGVIGLSIAWHLRRRGAETLVLERAGIGAGASGVQPGGVRQQWGTAVNCRLARESAGFYGRAQELLNGPVELAFTRCGYLFLAHSEQALARLRANADVQAAAGVPSRVVDAQEAGRLVPGLVTESLTGAGWCAEDGYVDRPQAMVEALARGTRVEVADVVEMRREAGSWRLALRDGSAARAHTVVVAAGVDSPSLLARLGVTLPIERESRWLFLSEPIRERLLEPLVVSAERRFAAKQLANGRVLASDLSAVEPSDAEAPRWRQSIRRTILELLPVLEYVDFTVLAHGLYDVTPDRQAILGRVPDAEQLWVATGFSGHGFMLAPAVGRILAEAVTGDAEDEALAVLDAGRFAEGRLIPEPQVV